MTTNPPYYHEFALHADGPYESECECNNCVAGYDDIDDEDEVIEAIYDYRWRTSH